MVRLFFKIFYWLLGLFRILRDLIYFGGYLFWVVFDTRSIFHKVNLRISKSGYLDNWVRSRRNVFKRGDN